MSDLLPAQRSSIPTSTTQGYAEFKFPAEQIIFGMVMYVQPAADDVKREDRIIITYSRNCHTWEPIREKRGYGDPRVGCYAILG